MTDQERPHHPYSPSTLQNLEACPCYQSRQSDHIRTIAGTLAHRSADTGEDDLKLSDDDAVAVSECLDFFEKRRELMQERANGKGVQEIREVYLPVDDLKFPDCESTTAGYPDRALICDSVAEVFDWKFGAWPVEDAENNLQGIAYSLGVFKKFPEVESITFWFKQPISNSISHAEFTRGQIPALYLRVQTVVARARIARADGDFKTARMFAPVCNFCSNIGKCPHVLHYALRVAKKFHPLEFPENVNPTRVTGTRDTTVAIRLAQTLKVWCDAFRRQTTDRVLRGESDCPPGFKIQQVSKRKLIDLDKYKEIALRYISLPEWESTLETTFGAVEQLVSDKAPRGSKTEVVKTFQETAEAAGAVKKDEPFSFLRAIAEKEEQDKNTKS